MEVIMKRLEEIILTQRQPITHVLFKDGFVGKVLLFTSLERAEEVKAQYRGFKILTSKEFAEAHYASSVFEAIEKYDVKILN
jgi:hypothetical protein